MLPTTKSKKVFDYRKINCLIYGVPKIGKTTFCSQLDSGDVLFLDTEGGTKHLTCFRVPLWDADWNDVMKTARELLTTDHQYKLVVVDTISKLYDKCIQHVCNQMKCDVTSPRFTNNGKGYGQVNTELKKLWSMLLAGNFGCYFIDHETSEELDESGNVLKFADPYKGNRIQRFRPALGGKSGAALQAGVDMILRCLILPDGQRVLQTQPAHNVIAGGRYADLLENGLPLNAEAYVQSFRTAHQNHHSGASDDVNS